KNPRYGYLQPSPAYLFSGEASTRSPIAAPTLGEHSVAVREELQRTRERQRIRQPARAKDRELPFTGLRVADLTQFWAGPTVSHYLAVHGAEVIHIESPQRPDGQRSITVKPEANEWFE